MKYFQTKTQQILIGWSYKQAHDILEFTNNKKIPSGDRCLSSISISNPETFTLAEKDLSQIFIDVFEDGNPKVATNFLYDIAA